MKNLNKFFSACILIMLCMYTAGCKKIDNFLNKAPGIDIDENVIFSSRDQFEKFIPTLYRYGLHPVVTNKESSLSPVGYPIPGSTYCYDECFTENAEAMAQSFSNGNVNWNTGNVTPGNIVNAEDSRYYIRWVAIRYINIVLERINDIPGIDQAYKNQIIGEVKTLRALNYFEMLKRYGGMPVVTKRFAIGEDINVPRSSVEDCVKFIVKDCDDAATVLPDSYPTNFHGRIFKGVPLAIKSKTLLYAASPLFNTATPYLSGANDKLICYGNFDKNRWKLAADAAYTALDWSMKNGYKLIVNQGIDKNYKYAWEVINNTEIIFADQFRGPANAQSYPWSANFPAGMRGYWDAVELTHNFVQKYERFDGTPVVWDAAGGNDLAAKYNELDLRFKQTVGYNQSYYNKEFPLIDLSTGSPNAAQLITGTWMKKFFPDALTYNDQIQPSFPYFRINELYLNYAEAINEFSGPGSRTSVPTPDRLKPSLSDPTGGLASALPTENSAYDAVDVIRLRSGQPCLSAGLAQSEMRERIRKERDIELVAESHHFWDLRRWLTADQDGKMRGAMQGITITKAGTLYRWVPTTFEIRTYTKNMNLFPLPLGEVLKGNLVQNPGW